MMNNSGPITELHVWRSECWTELLMFPQATLIHADIESAVSDARGGKVKKRPETLK